MPFTDLPEHVAVMATLSRWFDNASLDHATYSITFARAQYLLYHATGAALTRLLGDAILANRALLIGVAIALPLSVRSALRALGRGDGLAVLACMPFLSRPLFVGFLPYVASMPLYFAGIALVVRRARLPGRKSESLVLAALAVALFYTHLSAFMVFAVTAVALDVVLSAQRSDDESAAGRPPTTLSRWTYARMRAHRWLVPVGGVAALWSLSSRITLRGESLTDVGEIGRMNTLRALHALPLWTFDVFRSHTDELCGAVWWAIVALLAVLGVYASASTTNGVTGLPDDRPVLLRVLARCEPSYVPLFCVIVIYLVTPFRVGAGGMLNVRLAPLVALTAVLTVSPSRGRGRTALLCAASLTTLAHGANAVREIQVIANESMQGFDEILEAMRPGTKLVTLAFNQRATYTHFDSYPFAGSYHRARGGLVAGYSFSDLVHWPLQYRPGAAPPPKAAPLWIYHPCEYRHAKDGEYYDYVLVSGRDPFATKPAGPAFRERVRGAHFTLYEKVPDERWTGDDPGGPCAH